MLKCTPTPEWGMLKPKILSRIKYTKSSFFLVGARNLWLWFVACSQQHGSLIRYTSTFQIFSYMYVFGAGVFCCVALDDFVLGLFTHTLSLALSGFTPSLVAVITPTVLSPPPSSSPPPPLLPLLLSERGSSWVNTTMVRRSYWNCTVMTCSPL